MGFDAYLERRKLRSGGRSLDHHLCSQSVLRPDESSSGSTAVAGGTQPKRSVLIALLALGLSSLYTVPVKADKLSFDDRLEIERGLNAEYATMRVPLPRAKRPLPFNSPGGIDHKAWDKSMQENGPAARLGDEVQITRVEIESNKIVLEINGGTRSGHWYDHVQVGMGGTMSTANPYPNQTGQAAHGSHVAIVFPKGVPALKAAEIRDMLAPVFDFSKHSAAEQYMDKLPEPIKKAIKEQRATQGMDKDQVLLALGKPRNKSREVSREGDDLEDWIYGDPPGKVTFVRFSEGKVVKVEESYANVGGTTAPPLPTVR
jgi:hypothetical protein